MHRLNAVFPAVLALLLWTASCGEQEPWRPLFNGADLTGWQHVGKGEFVVEDGALKTAGGMGLLWYEREKIGHAVLRIVYKPESPSANAGVFIRIPEKPRDPWFPVHKGYEVQIQDTADEFHRTGALYSLTRADTFSPAADGWNTMEITLDGPVTEVRVNGTPVSRYEEGQQVPERKRWHEPQRGPRPDEGYIGLQNHDENSTVWFREVSVRPLAPAGG